MKTYCIRVPDAGCLDRGIANPRGESAQQAATRNATLGWFRELEPAAGVSQADGRGWYGLRRILMDTAPKYTSNEMSLNALAGTSTDMRNSVYQDQESLEAKVDAATPTSGSAPAAGSPEALPHRTWPS